MSDLAPVFIFGLVGWDYLWQRPNHLASYLARAGRAVIYFDPQFRLPGFFSRFENFGRWRRWHPGTALVGQTGWRRAVAMPGITVVSPPSPHPLTVDLLARSAGWKTRLGKDFVAYLARSLRSSRPPVLWLNSPYWYPLLRSVPRVALVYECIDWLEGFISLADARTFEEPLARDADAVIASSQALAQKMSEFSSHVTLIPNGAEVSHFAAARQSAAADEAPEDLAGIPRPIIGYYGVYGGMLEHFDADLVAALARRRPDWSFVFVGHSWGALATGEYLSNVYELGPRPYAELPTYLRHFDVAIIPFRRTQLTEAVSPVKLFEFLAAGKPVVATPIPEIAALGDVVELAEGLEEFEAAIERKLGKKEPERIRRRIEVAEANSWEARFSEVDRLLAKLEA